MDVSKESVLDVADSEPEVHEHAEKKVPPTVIRLTSEDHLTKYERVKRLSESSQGRQSRGDGSMNFAPTVHLHRYDELSIQSPKEKALNNGLDPIGLELISSTDMNTSTPGSEFSDKSDDTLDYLTSTNESPRRSRKNKEQPRADPDEMLVPEEDMEIEQEIELIHHSPSSVEPAHSEIRQSPSSIADILADADPGAESDSTMVMPSMDPPDSKRRKSHARSRSRSGSRIPSRKKSFNQQMKDELSITSDKDEQHEDEEDGTSEVSYITNRSLETRSVHPPPKPGWDSFCFKCHSDSMVLSLTCSKCKCSYHRQCVRPNPIPKNVEEFVCPECFEVESAVESRLNKYGHDKIDSNTLADMLTIILEKIRTYPDRELFENDIVVKGVKESTESLIVTQMSLKILESRIKSRFYKVTEAFIHDIKQLEHNWNIVDKGKAKTLKSILKYVNTEINELEACVFCYEKSFITGDWFVQPCKRPHLLIWAKLKGYPFWPAKVMSIDPRQHVDVRFFGAHDRAWVPAAHCMLFSEQDPNKTKGSTPTNNKSTSKTQKGIADAMKEKDDYIRNLREKYGFKYFKFREVLDPNELQKQLDLMLPGLKNHKENRENHHTNDKEVEGAHKEKLTLKIIKGESSNYQVEQKPTEKTRPNLYKVLSKNDDNADNEQPAKLSLIIKRKSNVEQETEKPKRVKVVNDTASETSESNASVQSITKVPKVPTQKHKKTFKIVDKEQIPDLVAIKKPKFQKHKSVDDTELLAAKRRQTRGSRFKSLLPEANKPLLVPVIVPPGTTEIQQLREVSESPVLTVVKLATVKQRSRSLVRSRSAEKEVKNVRRISSPHRPSIKRSLSESIKKTPSRRESFTKSETAPAVVEPPAASLFDPTVVIKDEPLSDNEQQFTLDDIPNLIQDRSGKKKLIVISTTDGNESSTSQQKSSTKAKKSFPNKIQINQVQPPQPQFNRSRDFMCSIPAGTTNSVQSPPTSNRSTPASDSQTSTAQLKSNVSSARATPNVAPAVSRPVNSSVNVPPLNYSTNNSRRSSTHSSSYMNGQHPNTYANNGHEPPKLLPRPHGVFVNDGNSTSRDIGPVSRMFTDNAFRITDFFKSVLIDSVSAFAPDVPAAENLMLRAENEKLQRDMQATKADCQLKMQELRREHQDEMDSLKKNYDDKTKNLQILFEQDKLRAVNEVRKQAEQEKIRAIEHIRKETKKTTWCSNCTKEARFYCCWNTSYCGQQCQKTHWQVHQKYCTNKNSANETSQMLQLGQQSNKQQNNESPGAAPSGSNRVSVLQRQPLQLQVQQTPLLPAPPVSIQQHLIIPPPGVNLMSPSMISGQQIFISKHPQIRLYHEPRENMPQNMILQAIPRNNESQGINVLSNVALQGDQLHQALANIASPMNQQSMN